MMTFQRTEDYGLVQRILTDARCWRRMVNDTAPPVEEFQVGPAPNIRYILACEDALALGVFLLVTTPATAPTGAEVHFCILPEEWGDTKRIAEGFLAWVWGKTSITYLHGPVPSYNKLALKLAESVGFVQQESFTGSVPRGGKKYNIIHLVMERPRNAHAAA